MSNNFTSTTNKPQTFEQRVARKFILFSIIGKSFIH